MADYSRKQWLAIRDNGGSLSKFYRKRARYIHVSCKARMVPNPEDPKGHWIPWVQRPGVTYRRESR